MRATWNPVWKGTNQGALLGIFSAPLDLGTLGSAARALQKQKSRDPRIPLPFFVSLFIYRALNPHRVPASFTGLQTEAQGKGGGCNLPSSPAGV